MAGVLDKKNQAASLMADIEGLSDLFDAATSSDPIVESKVEATKVAATKTRAAVATKPSAAKKRKATPKRTISEATSGTILEMVPPISADDAESVEVVEEEETLRIVESVVTGGVDKNALVNAARIPFELDAANVLVPTELVTIIDEISRYANRITGKHLGKQRVFWAALLLGLPETDAKDRELVEWVASSANLMSRFTTRSLQAETSESLSARVMRTEYEAVQHSTKMPRLARNRLSFTHDELSRSIGWSRGQHRMGVVATIALVKALPSVTDEESIVAFLNDLIIVVEECAEASEMLVAS
jgi:hypothetical protein